MAWNNVKRKNTFVLTMLDQKGNIVGPLEGFESGSITYEYYTDLRRIAKLSTRNDNYVANTYIKIEVKTQEESAMMGVFCVQSIEEQKTIDSVIKNYELASVAYKLKTSYTTHTEHYTGLQRLWTIMGLMDDGFVHFGAEQGVENWTHQYGDDGWQIEAGTCRLDTLVTLCSDFNVRYEPRNFDITVKPYVRPSTKPEQFRFTQDNGTIDGVITTEDASLTAINRAIVKYNNNSVSLVGVATASSSSPVAPAKRGQYVCDVSEVKSISPESQEGADKAAKKKLDETMPTKVYKFNGLYLGCHEGDVGSLEIDGEKHKVMIKSLDVTLNAAMMCSYELKEVYAND